MAGDREMVYECTSANFDGCVRAFVRAPPARTAPGHLSRWPMHLSRPVRFAGWSR